MAQIRVVDNITIIEAPLPGTLIDEAGVLYNLLRATYTADIYKLCRDSDGDLYISAEVPVGVLNAKALERLVRNAVELVDLDPIALNSFDRVTAQARRLQMDADLSAVLTLGRDDGEEAHLVLPSLARKSGVRCTRRGETRFLLTFGEMNLRVMAVCTGKNVSFVAPMSDMRPRRGNLRYYRRMAEINMKMNVCKVALDSDDDVAFMYELPGLDEESFKRMVRRMDEYVMRFGMELTLLA